MHDLHSPIGAVSGCDPDQAVARAELDAWILHLYRELLEREPGPAEHEDWVNVLLRGATRSDLRDAFIASDEYQQRTRIAGRKSAVLASGLFDAAWYLVTYRDVAAAGLDPLDHYCQYARAEHRAPNAYFDDAWYREKSGVPTDTDALLDYAERGEALGIPPGPHFDPAWYRAAYGLDDSTSPLAHFLRHRVSHRFAPCSRLWSVTHLLPDHPTPDAADPFLPFLAPGQCLAEAASVDITLLAASGLFDANYYQVVNDDVFTADIDPLTHFCIFGWKEGRNPSFYFNTMWYSETNPDVARLAVNPLVHYRLVGEAADRRPVVYFEPEWYRRTYAIAPTASPLAHYLANRRTQSYSPNSLFDPAWYLTQSGGNLHARRDPFAHYLVAGMHRDVRPSAGFDAAEWRRRALGRPTRRFRYTQSPERDNPLVHYMLMHYR